MKRLTLILCILTVLYSCKKDSTPDETSSPVPNEEVTEITADAINIVTGIQFQYTDGSSLFAVGNPNVKNDSIFMFPIPAKNTLQVRSSTKIDKVWILPAEKVSEQFQTKDFVYMLKGMDYDMDNSDATLVFSANNTVSNVTLDLNQYESGYYRIFIRLKPDGMVHWDNIYIDKTNDYNEAAALLRADWD